MRIVLVILTLSILSGCFNNHTSLATYDQSPRMNQGLAANYQESNSPTEEYVNRVAKRVMVVSNRPANKYNFVVQQDAQPELVLDAQTNTIMISTGALQQLQDEAQLAAALTLGMERLDNIPYANKASLSALYMAGYDPYALIDLQQHYIYSATSAESWLAPLFPTPPTVADMDATKALVEKMPKGLQRGTENYKQIING